MWYVTKGQNIDRIIEEFVNANYIWIILSMLISLFSHYIRALRWKLLIKNLNYNPPVSKVFYSLMTGYLTNMVLPRVGEVSRCVALSKTGKMPFNVLIGTVIAERFFDLICMFSILAVVVALQFSLLNSFLLDYLVLPMKSLVERNYLLIALIIIAAFIVIMALYFFIKYKFKNSETGSFFHKGKEHLKGVKAGLLSAKNMQSKILFVFYTLLMWTLYFFMVYVCFFALSSTSQLGPMTALTILALGSLGVAIPVPAGIGTYHFIVIISLTELFKVSAEPATSFAYLTHASQMLVVIIFGGFAWFKLAMKKSQISYKTIEEIE